ncbi:MAG: N-acetylneuraminate synthase family protein [Methanobacterium sp. ERen5]|nr:MAG: N-acetylneuraminate synthase family protein [Methanobacterium sp. ERen5]
MNIEDIPLGNKNINSKRTFVIAEISGSHNGNKNKMKKLIDIAYNSGADAVKIQKFKADDLVVKDYEYYEDLKRLEIDNSFWSEVVSYAKNKSIPLLVDIFDSSDVYLLSDMGVDGFKIHTTDINNLDLIKDVADKNKPLFLSIGAANLNDIENAISTVLEHHKNIILMYGFQSYPTPVEESKLGYIPILKEIFNLNVGFLDHTPGGSIESMSVPLVSMAMGATVIEKHITIDRKLKDPDYQSALNPDEFAQFIKLLRKVEDGIKFDGFELSMKEEKYAELVKRRIVSDRVIPAGKIIEKNDLNFKRAHTGLFINDLIKVIGRRAKIDLEKDVPITEEVFQ